jgi:hypothetical protein
MSDDPDELIFEPLEFAPGDDELERALQSIESLKQGWRPAEAPLKLGTARWRPDRVSGKKALHVALTGDIPQALMRRMRLARDAGFQITVAFGTRTIDIRTLGELQDMDGRVIALGFDDGTGIVASYRSIADWIAAERISLAPADLRALAESRLAAALAEPTNIKGRMYEETLCLVFSQVSWLTVDEHAYRNSSEEIDIVLGVHATGQVAQLAKGAVAIATAKNEATPTGSATVKYLKEQIANRKGRCRLGFLCSATTISGDAKREILRGSQLSDSVIVELDRAELRDLIGHAEELDQRVRRLLVRAVAA